jgi:glycosyltransferase involved in cell wall biosynthesis
MATPFKVSVRLMTYNHEQFIAQAIESVLAQKTDFPVELVIGDDFSTDNTLNIAKQYTSTQNITIKILNRQKGDAYWIKRQKLGRLFNFTDILSNCTGEYIAILDGDDFWSDPYKSQKQAAFLDSNPDYVFCFHNAKFLRDNGEVGYLRDNHKDEKDTYDFVDFCQHGVESAHTSSYFFRNNLLKFPPEFYKAGLADWPIKVLISEHGKTKYLPDVMSVYRIHSGGVWSGAGNKISLHVLSAKKFINNYYKGKYRKLIYSKYTKLILYYDGFTYYCKSHQLIKACLYALKVIYSLKFSLKNPYTITRAGTLKRLLQAFV